MNQEQRRQRSYKQIWVDFRAEFQPKGLGEQELRAIHLKWIRARAYAEGGPR